ncbi:lysine--tRNA ligase [Myxococcota bacterium]|nr:lysine--tRNA ligase [Myxococcota bacterium]
MSAPPTDPRPWPFVEAERLMEAVSGDAPGREVVFETGYGPSGLPHIGTFSEVARTTFVRRAFTHLTGRPSRLVAFSDDMDGLRKVPLNIPNPEVVRPHLGKPLTSVPDPFGTDASYADHMNRRLREFLDRFGFEYEFRSSTRQYRAGVFNEGLLRILERAQAVRSVIVPTLGGGERERREDWSPFFPVCPSCGRVYTTRVTAYHPGRGSISFACDAVYAEFRGCGEAGEIPVTDGGTKVGWKVDWALRWWTFGVDYEMYGKDLIESAAASSRIVEILGGRPPVGSFYEMFLDESGQKISKSVGKGITVDSWLEYGPVGSLLHYLYQSPRKAKKLTYDAIPKAVDEYLDQLRRLPATPEAERPGIPAWFFQEGEAPRWTSRLDWSLVRNLVACLGVHDEEVILGYLARYDPAISAPENEAMARSLVAGAIAFDRDFEAPHRSFRAPTGEEAPLLRALADRIAGSEGQDADEVQALSFDVAREAGVPPKVLFQAVYEGLLGQSRGPRLGSFVLALGRDEAVARLRALAGREGSGA